MKTRNRIILGGFIGLLMAVGAVSVSYAQTPLSWVLKGTGLDRGHAYAILSNKTAGKQQWVGVGQSVDELRVVRIDRSQVVVSDREGQRTILPLPGDEKDLPPLFSSPRDKASPGEDLNAFLDDVFGSQMKNPTPISQAQRQKLVEELATAFKQGKIEPASTTLIVGGGEEWVEGMRSSEALGSLGIQKGDLILMINGITPDANKKRWEEIMDILRRARLIMISYAHGEELVAKTFKVQEPTTRRSPS